MQRAVRARFIDDVGQVLRQQFERRVDARVAMWMEKLRTRPEFAREIAMPPEAVTRLEATRLSQVEAGKTLEAVAGF